jgi:hypothetical protein
VQEVLALLPSFPFAPPSAVRTLLFPQDSSGTFASRPSEVYIPTHGEYTAFGTHVSVLRQNIVRIPCTLIASCCKPETKFSSTNQKSGVVAFRQTRWLFLPCPWPCRCVPECADSTKAASSRCCPSIGVLAAPQHRYLMMCGRSMLLQRRGNHALSCAFPYDPICDPQSDTGGCHGASCISNADLGTAA